MTRAAASFIDGLAGRRDAVPSKQIHRARSGVESRNAHAGVGMPLGVRPASTVMGPQFAEAGVASGLREPFFRILSVSPTHRWDQPGARPTVARPPAALRGPSVSREILPLSHSLLLCGGVIGVTLWLTQAGAAFSEGMASWGRLSIAVAALTAGITAWGWIEIRPNTPKPANTAFAALPISTHSPQRAALLSRLLGAAAGFLMVFSYLRFVWKDDGANENDRASTGR